MLLIVFLSKKIGPNTLSLEIARKTSSLCEFLSRSTTTRGFSHPPNSHIATIHIPVQIKSGLIAENDTIRKLSLRLSQELMCKTQASTVYHRHGEPATTELCTVYITDVSAKHVNLWKR